MAFEKSVETTILHSVGELKSGYVVKRPSKKIKSPYVADVVVADCDDEMLGHTPALGCCGLVEAESNVYMIETPGNKCQYRILISQTESKGVPITVGVAPKLAEKITRNALERNLIQHLDVDATTIEAEKKFLNSRFDFCGKTKDGVNFVLEVKNVPLADFEDMCAKERRTLDTSGYEWNDKVAYFPDGYRKKKNAPVSERAIKHVRELMELKQTHGDKIRCVLLFVIQRRDVSRFQPSVIDPHYRVAIQEAWKYGVEVRTLQVEWNVVDGNCYYLRNNLPCHLFVNYGPKNDVIE